MGGVPIRTCTGCRRRRPQAELIRVACHRNGSVSVDRGGRAPGRGAYVCPNPACVERSVSSGALDRTLRRKGPLPTGLKDELLSRAGE